jgi:hypothetical protein
MLPSLNALRIGAPHGYRDEYQLVPDKSSVTIPVRKNRMHDFRLLDALDRIDDAVRGRP